MAYSEEEKESLVNQVCELLEKGNSLRSALTKVNISSQTFYAIIDIDEEKSKQYARACEERADAIFEDILKISDASEDDLIIDENGNPVTNHNVIQRDRLRVDSRKWMLSKMQPKKYGNKLDLTTGGEKINTNNPNLPDIGNRK